MKNFLFIILLSLISFVAIGQTNPILTSSPEIETKSIPIDSVYKHRVIKNQGKNPFCKISQTDSLTGVLSLYDNRIQPYCLSNYELHSKGVVEYTEMESFIFYKIEMGGEFKNIYIFHLREKWAKYFESRIIKINDYDLLLYWLKVVEPKQKKK